MRKIISSVLVGSDAVLKLEGMKIFFDHYSKRNIKSRLLCLLIFLTAGFFTGCSSSLESRLHSGLNLTSESFPYAGLKDVDGDIPDGKTLSITQRLAQQGIRQLSKGDLVAANQSFNQALMFEPANSRLQWLNGVAYHLRLVQGESSQFTMAQEAYRLSIKFDPSNWLAHFQLGLLYLDNRAFTAAQEAFAEALLFQPRNPDLLYLMSYAAYYNHDPEFAAGTLAELQKLEPSAERTLRSAPIILAAVGNDMNARSQLALYQSEVPDSLYEERLANRVEDWQNFYQYNRAVALALASDENIQITDHEQVGRGATPQQFMLRDQQDEMVVVDVAIIESQEDMGTRKGVNLLNGLRVQYGLDRITSDRRTENSTIQSGINNNTSASSNSSTSAYNNSPSSSYSSSSTNASSSQGGSFGDVISDSFSRTLTQAISIPQLDYSLNIFNSNRFKNEVLARPTLIALNGQSSNFFAGRNIQAAATATSGTGAVAGGEAITLDEDVGVNLVITPTLRTDGRIKIDVGVTRTFLELPDDAIDYQFRLQTAKTHVNASVVMAFGESLILSGISEKETERVRDGVPVLQDIPVLQYLFSEDRTLDFQKSVLIMITPRRPHGSSTAQHSFENGGDKEGKKAIHELQQRFSSWFHPVPNWVDIAQHMEESELYREFRTGDLTLQSWSETEAFRSRFEDVLKFIYY